MSVISACGAVFYVFFPPETTPTCTTSYSYTMTFQHVAKKQNPRVWAERQRQRNRKSRVKLTRRDIRLPISSLLRRQMRYNPPALRNTGMSFDLESFARNRVFLLADWRCNAIPICQNRHSFNCPPNTDTWMYVTRLCNGVSQLSVTWCNHWGLLRG